MASAPNWKPKLYLSLAILFAATSLFLLTAVAVGAAYENRVLPFTYLAGESVGSTRYSDVSAKVAPIVTNVEGQVVPIILGENQLNVSLADIGVSVSVEKTQTTLAVHRGAWEWTKPSFWRQFLAKKSLAPHYEINEEQFAAGIQKNLGNGEIATDAQVVVVNNELSVKEAKTGRTLDNNAIRAELAAFLAGKTGALQLEYAVASPKVTTEQAQIAKTEIADLVRPLYLSFENQKFTISAAELYNTVTYTPGGEKLDWQFDEEKLTALLNTRITSKLTVKMVQKVIENHTDAVITEGRDGRDVLSGTLLASVVAAINSRADTKEKPLIVPTKTVAFTEKRVDPAYQLSMFDGLYVYINLAKQRIYIINKDQKQQEYLISSGKASLPTPKGQFYIKNKIDIARSRLYPDLWMRKWNALSRNADGSGYEGYGIHDLPCFDKDCTRVEGAAHLGRPVSHGCVRLGPESAAWFYDNIPIGTPVYIN